MNVDTVAGWVIFAATVALAAWSAAAFVRHIAGGLG